MNTKAQAKRQANKYLGSKKARVEYYKKRENFSFAMQISLDDTYEGSNQQSKDIAWRDNLIKFGDKSEEMKKKLITDTQKKKDQDFETEYFIRMVDQIINHQ